MSPLRRTLETAVGAFGGGPALNGDAAAAGPLMVAMEEVPQARLLDLASSEPCAGYWYAGGAALLDHHFPVVAAPPGSDRQCHCSRKALEPQFHLINFRTK